MQMSLLSNGGHLGETINQATLLRSRAVPREATKPDIESQRKSHSAARVRVCMRICKRACMRA